MIRLLLPDAQQGTVTVDGLRFHHLRHVLRAEVGQALEVFDGSGRTFPARVETLTTSAATLSLEAPVVTAPPRPLAVVQGLPKGDKLELVLQKCTELGATAFLPTVMARSVVRPEGKWEARETRWQRIIEESARQCGRADVPSLKGCASLTDALDALAPDTLVLVLDEAERAVTLSIACSSLQSTARGVAVVVGPEGGVDDAERALLRTRGATTVTLGPSLLRTETAALVAVALVRHLDGHLG